MAEQTLASLHEEEEQQGYEEKLAVEESLDSEDEAARMLESHREQKLKGKGKNRRPRTSLDPTQETPAAAVTAPPTGPPPTADAPPTGPPPAADAAIMGPPPTADAPIMGPPPTANAPPTAPPTTDATTTSVPAGAKELAAAEETKKKKSSHHVSRQCTLRKYCGPTLKRHMQTHIKRGEASSEDLDQIWRHRSWQEDPLVLV